MSSVPYFENEDMEHNPFAEHANTGSQQDDSAKDDVSNSTDAIENQGADSDMTSSQQDSVQTNVTTLDHEISTAQQQESSSNAMKQSGQEIIPQSSSENMNPQTGNRIESDPVGNSTPAPYDDISILPERKFGDKYKIIIKVTGLERVGSLTNKRENPTIIFNCSTNMPIFRKKNYKNIKKTINEFKNLFKYLNGSIQESFVPTLPQPFTNFGINNHEDYDQTIHNFQEWFDRITKDPLILSNEEFVFFIESDFNTYSPISKMKPTVTGLKRKTLKQLAPPYDEVIILAEFRPMIKSIYLIDQNLQERLLKMNKIRRKLVQEENLFGSKFIILGGNENANVNKIEPSQNQNRIHSNNNNKINKLYKKYGKIMITVSDINSILSTMEIATFYDGLQWIIGDTYNIKESLTNRHFLMRELIQAQNNSKIKQEQARKLRNKRDTNPLRVDEALRNLKAATQIEKELTLNLKRVTTNMLIERKNWLAWYTNHLQQSIKQFTLKKIEFERKKLSLLERVRIDVRTADSQGGLSRLGRERVSETTEITSQTVEGDSWTGENRHRSQKQVDNVTRTDFDDDLDDETDQETSRARINNNEYDSSNLPSTSSVAMDARNAATLLGMGGV